MNEKTLLQQIQAISRKTGAKNLDDDAAILGELIISTDQFIENTHFRWRYQSPELVGYKGVVQALSDLAAMATRPQGLLVSAGFPPLHKDKLPGVLKGVEQACLEYKVPLIGGDLSQSHQETYLDFVVFGNNPHPIRKSGASANDLLVVSGPLGSAHGGLLCLENNWTSPTLTSHFLEPKAQIELAQHLSQHITSLTDISDSLSKSVHDLSRHSHVGFTVDLEKIPRESALEDLCKTHSLNLQEILLTGGEDYQLLMTLPHGTSEKLISDHGLTIIGTAQNDLQNYWTLDGRKSLLSEAGWDPFRL